MTLTWKDKTVNVQQMTTTQSMWRLAVDKTTVGCIMIYVDDVMIIGEIDVVRKTIEMFTKPLGVQGHRSYDEQGGYDEGVLGRTT